MTKAPSMGFSFKAKGGKNNPAATGMPMMLDKSPEQILLLEEQAEQVIPVISKRFFLYIDPLYLREVCFLIGL